MGSDATVLDLGAGTGKLTRVLADRYARVIAVEPLAELRAILAERCPTADVRDGAAERIPLGDAEVDAVFAGQAFHWFANDAAVGEIARVLRPGGVLALLWNRPTSRRRSRGIQAPPCATARRRAAPAASTSTSSNAFPSARSTKRPCEHEQASSRDDVLAFAASVSWIARRDDRDEMLDELAGLLPPGEYVFSVRTRG